MKSIYIITSILTIIGIGLIITIYFFNKQRSIPQKLTEVNVKYTSNEFDFEKVKVGDTIAGMTIKSINPLFDQDKLSPQNYVVEFTGKTTVTGKYSSSDSELLAAKVCMTNLNQESQNRLPKVKDTDREIWFCFIDNNNFALTKLGPVNSSGTATVTIDNYTLRYGPTFIFDKAKLVDVVTKTAPS